MSTELVKTEQTAVQRAQDFMPVFDIGLAVERRNSMVEFVQQIMVKDVDFGTIPGTDKPCLYKPGAEKLSTFFGLSPEFVLTARIEDWTGKEHLGEPLFYYCYKCRLMKNGRLIGEGDGSSSTWESKYRYRWYGESQVPAGLDKAKLVSRDGRKTLTEFTFAVEKKETTGKYGKPAEYWEQFEQAIANKTVVRTKRKTKTGESDAWQITVGEKQYRVPNPDVADVVNTVQKMAQKRALIAAILIGVNASEFFTQDVEDMVPLDAPTSHHAEVIDAEVIEEPKGNGKPAATQPEQKKETPVVPRTAEEAESLPFKEWPTEVKNMRARMVDKFSALECFGEMKEMLVQILGKEAGQKRYYDLLMKYGNVEKSDQFKRMGQARDCASYMLMAVFDIARMKHRDGNQFLTQEDGQAAVDAATAEEGKLFDTERDMTYAD